MGPKMIIKTGKITKRTLINHERNLKGRSFSPAKSSGKILSTPDSRKKMAINSGQKRKVLIKYRAPNPDGQSKYNHNPYITTATLESHSIWALLV